MNCAATRELLPEHALGVSGTRGRAIAEHLAWCAACRKEARDLQQASATLAFALAPAPLPEALEGRVVDSLRQVAGRPPARRRPRRTLTFAVAAAVALAGLGGGAVLATRDPGLDQSPAAIAQRREDGLDAFTRLIAATQAADGRTDASLAVLMPRDGGPSGGSAMAMLSPSVRDRVIVITSGLRDDHAALPYTAWLADAAGSFIKVGRARTLTSGGGFTVAAIVKDDLRTYVNVLVRDARGRVVLSGTLTSNQVISSPSP